jgi:hypothetical protein
MVDDRAFGAIFGIRNANGGAVSQEEGGQTRCVRYDDPLPPQADVTPTKGDGPFVAGGGGRCVLAHPEKEEKCNRNEIQDCLQMWTPVVMGGNGCDGRDWQGELGFRRWIAVSIALD